MRSRKTVLCLLALLLLPVSAGAAPMIDIEGAIGIWRTSPDGTVAYDPVSGTDLLDIEDDLSFDDETEFTARLKIDMPPFIPNLYFMVNPMEFEGTATRSIEFNFGDLTFGANVPYKAELSMDQYDVGLFYGVPLMKTASLYMLNLEGGLNVRIIDAEARIRETLTGLEESEKETFVLPMLYLGAQFQPIERFAFEAEARGVTYDGESIVSLIGRLKVKAVGPLFVAGGYRYEDYDVDYNDFIIDVTFSGPFIETGFNF